MIKKSSKSDVSIHTHTQKNQLYKKAKQKTTSRQTDKKNKCVINCKKQISLGINVIL